MTDRAISPATCAAAALALLLAGCAKEATPQAIDEKVAAAERAAERAEEAQKRAEAAAIANQNAGYTAAIEADADMRSTRSDNEGSDSGVTTDEDDPMQFRSNESGTDGDN